MGVVAYREQKDVLYEDDRYYKVFDPTEAERDLVCHYLWKAVQRSARNASVKRDRGSGSSSTSCISEWAGLKACSKAFIADGEAAQGIEKIRVALQATSKAGLDAAERFYDAKAAPDEEPTNFFRRKHLDPPHSLRPRAQCRHSFLFRLLQIQCRYPDPPPLSAKQSNAAGCPQRAVLS